MGRPHGARRARGRETKPGPAALGLVLWVSGFFHNLFRRMDTFLLAWGFLGLCLPGSGGTAETGKAPSGMTDVPVRPTFGFPGAVPVSRIDALRGNKFRECMSCRPRHAAFAARVLEGLRRVAGRGWRAPGKERSGCSRAAPSARLEGARGWSRTGKLRAGFCGSCGQGRGSGRDQPHVGHPRPNVRGPAPVVTSGNFR